MISGDRNIPKIRKGQQKHPQKGSWAFCVGPSWSEIAIGLQWCSGMNSAPLRRTHSRSSPNRSSSNLMYLILKCWLQAEGPPSLDGCTHCSYLLKHKMWERRFLGGGKKRIDSRTGCSCPARGLREWKRDASGTAVVLRRLYPPTALTVLWSQHGKGLDCCILAQGGGYMFYKVHYIHFILWEIIMSNNSHFIQLDVSFYDLKCTKL